MKRERTSESTDRVRRKLLRASTVLGGAFVAGQLPYTKPAIKSFFGTRQAWAQPTVPFGMVCSAQASFAQGPGTACQEAVIQNVTATVTPAPPAGTLLRCTPTTTDPNNATLPTFSPARVGTNAAGTALFADLDLTGNVPNPPLAVGSVLTMTVTFDDQATFGTASCANVFTIVACT